MTESYCVYAVCKTNVYIKILYFQVYEYSTNRQLLMDIITFSKKYPEANIVVLKGETIIYDIRYQNSPEQKMSYKELLHCIDFSNKTLTSNYQLYEEQFPWTVRIKGPFKNLQFKSFIIDSDFAKEFAKKQSIENPDSTVFVEMHEMTRLIFKNGIIKKDFLKAPDKIEKNKFGKKRWYSI